MDYHTMQSHCHEQKTGNLKKPRRTVMQARRRHITILFSRTLRLTLTAVVTLLPLNTDAQDTRQYTDDKPLVIACDWDFPPYEFQTDGNMPAGFHVDLLNIILNRLDIPHKFAIDSRSNNVRDFQDGEADLIFDYRNRFSKNKYSVSRSVFHYYVIVAATNSSKEPLRTIAQLKQQPKVMLNSTNDSVVYTILRRYMSEKQLEFHTYREALGGIVSGKYDYFLWGEDLIQWRIKELALSDITYSRVGIPGSEVRLVGHNSQLISEIDDQFTRMELDGEIEDLHTKWFEKHETQQRTTNYSLFIAIASLLLLAIAYTLYRLVQRRVRMAVRRNEDIESMMHQSLNMGNYSVLNYNPRTQKLTNLHGKTLPANVLEWNQFLDRIHPSDQAVVLQKIKAMVNDNNKSETFDLRWNASTRQHPVWRNIHGTCFTEQDKYGHTKNIIITTQDITDATQRDRNEQALAGRFQKMFESTLVAMSFYDVQGRLIDLNENMRKLCCPTYESEQFFRQMSLFDVPLLKGDFDPNSREAFHICQRMYYPDAGVDVYIEFRLRPTFNESGELIYYAITARDITNERNVYNEIRRHEQELQKAKAITSSYEQRLRSILESNNMFVWRYYLSDQTIYFSRSLSGYEYSMSRDEYVKTMFEDEQKESLEHTQKALREKTSFSIVHHFHKSPIMDEPCWYAISGMPFTDDDGNLIGLMGLVRDITELMEAQERLRQETARAEDSGRQKSAFLANMTHEIRTPLNAIIGFSDLLHQVETPEERQEFIRIIRNNCDMLLRLINDIIETSDMDEGLLPMNRADIDFSAAFDDICHSLSNRVQESGVQFIIDNPYRHLYTHIDKERLQQVITNFVTNAVKYTSKGHIRVGYRTQDNGLYIYCEDTGAGIPKDKQASVFERFVKLNDFVQGTGLGLSICKSIMDRCGGRIGVDSEGEGKGSTFWIWAPCVIKGIDKKD